MEHQVKTFQELNNRFEYHEDHLNLWEILPNQGKVKGNCIDFAMTLWSKTTGDIWLTDIHGNSEINHAVVCWNTGLCADNAMGYYWKDNSKQTFIHKLTSSEIVAKLVEWQYALQNKSYIQESKSSN